MQDLRSKPLIVLKGLLFLGLAVFASALILVECASWRLAVLLAVLVWSACRFYYFLFYALEKYVDPGLRYAGLLALVRKIGRRRKSA